MNLARRLLARSLPVVMFSVPTMQGVAAPEVAADCGTIRILAGELSGREAETLLPICGCRACEGKALLGRHLEGADPRARRFLVPYLPALVPGHLGDRGFVEMPLRRVRGNDGALLQGLEASGRLSRSARS